MFGFYFGLITLFTLLMIVYISIALFTFIRALDFNIKLSPMVAAILPLMLLHAHIEIYKNFRQYDKKKARNSLKFLFIKYPVALTILLTIVANTSVAKITKKEVSYKKATRKRVGKSKARRTFDKVLSNGSYNGYLNEIAI